MRKKFISELIKIAKKDKKVILLTGDLGFNFIEPFAKLYPDRFINCGVIEQSMVGIACGLADMGMKPYVYSASTFLIFRALEQVRNDVCYENRNVKLVGFAGKNYNFLGHSHLPQNDEDIKMLKMFPNIKIYENCEVNKSYKTKKPCYLRLV
jgi:transketolase